MPEKPEIKAVTDVNIITTTTYFADGKQLYFDQETTALTPEAMDDENVILNPNKIGALIDREENNLDYIENFKPGANRIVCRGFAAGFGLLGILGFFGKAPYTPEIGGGLFVAVLGSGEYFTRHPGQHKRNKLEAITGRIAMYKSLLPQQTTEVKQ